MNQHIIHAIPAADEAAQSPSASYPASLPFEPSLMLDLDLERRCRREQIQRRKYEEFDLDRMETLRGVKRRRISSTIEAAQSAEDLSANNDSLSSPSPSSEQVVPSSPPFPDLAANVSFDSSDIVTRNESRLPSSLMMPKLGFDDDDEQNSTKITHRFPLLNYRTRYGQQWH